MRLHYARTPFGAFVSAYNVHRMMPTSCVGPPGQGSCLKLIDRPVKIGLLAKPLAIYAVLVVTAMYDFCVDGLPQGTDTIEATKKMLPVWQASGAIYPSIYEATQYSWLTNSLRRKRMVATVNMSVFAASLRTQVDPAHPEKRIPVRAPCTLTLGSTIIIVFCLSRALRNCVRHFTFLRYQVYPFAWEAYHNGSALLTHQDLKIEIIEPYNAVRPQLLAVQHYFVAR